MNHIVIGVDGSPAATAAARWAACEAAMRDVELTIVHVLRSAPDALPLTGWPAIPLPAEVGEDQLAQGEKILDDTLEVIAKTIGVRQPRSIASRVCIGAVVPTLSGFSHKGSQMIVVGRRGRGGIHRALLGSVSSGVLHNAHGPVAVVHDHASADPPSAAPVVVGVDGPPASESAIAVAFDEASRRGVDVVAVHGFRVAQRRAAEARGEAPAGTPAGRRRPPAPARRRPRRPRPRPAARVPRWPTRTTRSCSTPRPRPRPRTSSTSRPRRRRPRPAGAPRARGPALRGPGPGRRSGRRRSGAAAGGRRRRSAGDRPGRARRRDAAGRA